MLVCGYIQNMPCYGETVCILCKIGLAENPERLKYPGISVPPNRNIPNHDLPEWISEGSVYIGNDYPVFNLIKDPCGYMGSWIDNNGNRLNYHHIHPRCWRIAESMKDRIMSTIKEPTLCKSLIKLIYSYNSGRNCPNDKSFKNHPRIKREDREMSVFDRTYHGAHYNIYPYGDYWKYMGQACRYASFLEDGYQFPTDNDVRELLNIMLEGRDWNKAPKKRNCPEDCLYCVEKHSQEELDAMKLDPGEKWNVLPRISEDIGKKLGLSEDYYSFTDEEHDIIHATQEYKDREKQYWKDVEEYKKLREKLKRERHEAWLKNFNHEYL